MPDEALHAVLDIPLPAEVAVGEGTALFVCGWCFSPVERIQSLHFVLDGEAQPVMAHGMPRLDPFRELHPGLDPFAVAPDRRDPDSPEDPLLLSYRSGFWGLVRIEPQSPGDAERTLGLRAELASGETAYAELRRIRTVAALTAFRPTPETIRGAVAICMATHNPPADLLARQLDSIRAQRYDDWVCFVSDDCSRPEAFQALEAEVADDPRFVVSRSGRRLGFYHNFERALAMVPSDAKFVALADQDDFWHPDKLDTLVANIGDAQLIYSDARIVARDGTILSDTYWGQRRNNHSDLESLLVANSVTGAASLFRRELLEIALPFPPAQFAHYHDHWLALTALTLGRIEFVDQPLYDYVQHGAASLGHATANRMHTLRDRLGSLRARSPRERVRKWRMHYFVDVMRLLQFAAVLELRCGTRIASGKRRVLRRFERGDASLPLLARLFARGARELIGRPETLGAEWMLFYALLWRRLLALTARGLPQRQLRFDAVPPPDLSPEPEREPVGSAAVRSIAEKIAPLRLEARVEAPQRINLLIPTIDLDHLFGGYIAKLNLARRLADQGHRVRVVTVDPVGRLPRNWRGQLESYSGLAGLTERVEFLFGRESIATEANPDDSFIATTWWTAHIAHHAANQLGSGRFLYLIQEYEPFTFPMGTYAALAEQSYAFPHSALFSTELLRDYFRARSIGVYANGVAAGDASSASFQNAITTISPPTAAELSGRPVRRLLFYARPEQHAARNLFELGVLAVVRAIADGCFQQGWELRGIGAVESQRRLPLGPGLSLELLPRSNQTDYARLLREHDLGLALMYTPHPSLVPIEMASAGMLTVSNTFANKTAEALSAISSNLIAVPPAVEDIATALTEAAAEVEDIDRRLRGTHVHWSRTWDESFDDQTLDWIASALARPVAEHVGA
jgi:glycosyltransferase involved in cell wall biosynthesis